MAGAMPTLVVGMLKTRKYSYMPTTSVGMAPDQAKSGRTT